MPHRRRGVYSGAASINILSLKCGVYSSKYGKGQLLCIEMNRLKRESSLVDVIRGKQGHIVRYVQSFNIQGLWIVFPYCLAGTKTSEEL